MKKPTSYFLILCLLFFSQQGLHAQQPASAVKWQYELKKISGKEYELHVTAFLGKDFHIYSQQQPEDAIAQPTVIKLNPNPLVLVSGTPKEVGKKILHKEEEVGISAFQYSDKVEFVQPFKLKAPVKTNLNGVITYEVCDSKQCYTNLSETFSLKIE